MPARTTEMEQRSLPIVLIILLVIMGGLALWSFNGGPENTAQSIGIARIRNASLARGTQLLCGDATTARLNAPEGLGSDAQGNVYVADSDNHAIRKYQNGALITIAGTGQPGYVDGPAASAQFNHPRDVAVAGNGDLYVTDWGNHRIRKISNGIVSTVAGTGQAGFQDGPAAQARFYFPTGIAINGFNGDIVVADSGNFRIRRIANGIVSTLAGNGTNATPPVPPALATNSPVGSARFIVWDSGPNSSGSVDPVGYRYYFTTGNALGVLYLSAQNNQWYTTLFVGGYVTPGLQDGYYQNARFSNPLDLTLVSPGYMGYPSDAPYGVLVADWGNDRIRFVNHAGFVTTFAGANTGFSDGLVASCASVTTPTPQCQAQFFQPAGVSADTLTATRRVFVSDRRNNALRAMSVNRVVTTIAGPTPASGLCVSGCPTGFVDCATGQIHAGCFGQLTCETFPGPGPSICSNNQDCVQTCGNQACEITVGETHANCPQDCASTCGNLVCDLGEDEYSCVNDCAASCGNNVCEPSENSQSCPADCHANDPFITYREFAPTVSTPIHGLQCLDAGCTSTARYTPENGEHPVGIVPLDLRPAWMYTQTASGVPSTLRLAKCDTPACTSFTYTTLDTSTLNPGVNFVSVYGRSLAALSDSNPILAYGKLRPGQPTALEIVACSTPTCSGNLIHTTVTGTGHTGQDVSVAVGRDDRPLIAYTDNGSPGFLHLLKCDTPACDQSHTNVVQPGILSRWPSLAFAQNGLPFLVYQAGTTIKAIPCTNDDCSQHGVPVLLANDGRKPSVVIPSDDRPFITYQDTASGDLIGIKCDTLACQTFVSRGLDTGSGDAGYYNSLALNANGFPFVVYYKNEVPTGPRNTLQGIVCLDMDCAAFQPTGILDEPIWNEILNVDT